MTDSPGQQAAAAIDHMATQQSVGQVGQQAQAQAQRPIGTSRAYNAKQQEFMTWAEQTLPDKTDACVVTEAKLVAFLHHCVVDRAKRRSGKGTVGVQTIKQYVSAVTDLWAQQKGAGMNTHPTPRGDLVKEIIASAKTAECQRLKPTLEDPGKGTILDSCIIVDELDQLAQLFFDANSPVGHRNRLALLLCRAGMLRSDEIRDIEYSHIQCHEMQQLPESETRCMVYHINLRQGKASQINNVQYASFLRAKDVEACPVSALAFHLFERDTMGRDSCSSDNRTFPNLITGEDWYQIKLLDEPPNDLQQTMDYIVHRQACEDAYVACGRAYYPDQETHAMRGSACHIADLGDASDANMECAGRREQRAGGITYMRTVPKEAMRALAGFHPKGGDFFIARAAADPPSLLKRQIFPELEAWEDHLSTCPSQDRHPAAAGFIRTLKELRTVILQDAVLLRQTHPDNYLWNYPIFQHPAFRDYETKLQEAMKYQALPVEMTLREGMLDLIAYRQSANAAILAALKDLKYDNTDIASRLGDVTRSLLSTVKLYEQVTTLGNLHLVSNGGSQSSSFINPSSSNDQSCEVLARSNADSRPSSRYSPYPLSSGSVTFSMSRKIISISNAWLEYDKGLDSQPSIRQSYEEGAVKGWKANDTVRKFDDRRMVLINLIKEQAILRQISPEDLAMIMEARRLELPPKECSLAKVQERIKTGRAANLVSD